MNTPVADQPIPMQVRALVILMLAMTGGVVLFFVVALVVGPLWNAEEEGVQAAVNILSIIVVGFAMMMLGVSALVYRSGLKRIAGREGPQERIAAWRGMAIPVVAISEGAALFGIVVLMLTGNLLTAVPGLLAFAVALYLVAPTPARVQTWVHEQSNPTD
jgi:hypothetical protein